LTPVVKYMAHIKKIVIQQMWDKHLDSTRTHQVMTRLRCPHKVIFYHGTQLPKGFKNFKLGFGRNLGF